MTVKIATFDRDEEKKLLGEWFETTNFDKTSPGVPNVVDDAGEAEDETKEMNVPGWEGSVGPFKNEHGKPHVYARDIHSGAGNCVCGDPVKSKLHVQAAPGVPVPDDKSFGYDLESKVRHVRTPAGERRYGQPVGSIIVRDRVLSNLTIMPSKYSGFTRVRDKKGNEYDVGKHDGKWIATRSGDWHPLATADNEDGIYEALDKHVGGGKTPAAPAPRKRALPGKTPTAVAHSENNPHIKKVNSPYKAYEAYDGADGQRYYVARDPDTHEYVALDPKDNEIHADTSKAKLLAHLSERSAPSGGGNTAPAKKPTPTPAPATAKQPARGVDARTMTDKQKIAHAEEMYGTDRSKWPKRAQQDIAKIEGSQSGDGLDKMTVAQLRQHARDNGMSSVTRLTTKPALLAAIRKHHENQAAAADKPAPKPKVPAPTKTPQERAQAAARRSTSAATPDRQHIAAERPAAMTEADKRKRVLELANEMHNTADPKRVAQLQEQIRQLQPTGHLPTINEAAAVPQVLTDNAKMRHAVAMYGSDESKWPKKIRQEAAALRARSGNPNSASVHAAEHRANNPASTVENRTTSQVVRDLATRLETEHPATARPRKTWHGEEPALTGSLRYIADQHDSGSMTKAKLEETMNRIAINHSNLAHGPLVLEAAKNVRKAKVPGRNGTQAPQADIRVDPRAQRAVDTLNSHRASQAESNFAFKKRGDILKPGADLNAQAAALRSRADRLEKQGGARDFAEHHATIQRYRAAADHLDGGAGVPKTESERIAATAEHSRPLGVSRAQAATPLMPNGWGTFEGTNGTTGVNFHPDSATGRGINSLTEDEKRIPVNNGVPLADALGMLATDVTQGRVNAAHQNSSLAHILMQIPESSPARKKVQRIIDDISRGSAGFERPILPDNAPDPVRNFVHHIETIPLVRREPRALTRVMELMQRWEDGRLSPLALIRAIRSLQNTYHESNEGQAEYLRGVSKLLQDLESLHTAGGLRPPVKSFLADEMKAFKSRGTKDDGEDEHTGAMVALIPSDDDLQRIYDPLGESMDELHVTLAYLGKASSISPDAQMDITSDVSYWSNRLSVVEANTFSVNIFNPTGDEPCVVLGVGNGDSNLEDVHDNIWQAVKDAASRTNFSVPDQHTPWVPHITLRYFKQGEAIDMDWMKDQFEKLGPITFDKVRVVFAGKAVDFKLQEGMEESEPAVDGDETGYQKDMPMKKCKYCDSPATKKVIHSGGMGSIAACDDHFSKAKRDAARSTKDGSVDWSNIDMVRNMKATVITPGGRVGDNARHNFSPRQNWVDKRGGLPEYIRIVRNGLIKHGHSEGQATALAVAAMKRWASGRGHVTPKVRAAAAAALAQWEAMKGSKALWEALDLLTKADASYLNQRMAEGTAAAASATATVNHGNNNPDFNNKHPRGAGGKFGSKPGTGGRSRDTARTLSNALKKRLPMSYGQQGPVIQQLQVLLDKLGLGSTEEDGIFGDKTQAGVKAAQERFGLDQTGQVDETLMTALLNAAHPSKRKTSSTKH